MDMINVTAHKSDQRGADKLPTGCIQHDGGSKASNKSRTIVC